MKKEVLLITLSVMVLAGCGYNNKGFDSERVVMENDQNTLDKKSKVIGIKAKDSRKRN